MPRIRYHCSDQHPRPCTEQCLEPHSHQPAIHRQAPVLHTHTQTCQATITSQVTCSLTAQHLPGRSVVHRIVFPCNKYEMDADMAVSGTTVVFSTETNFCRHPVHNTLTLHDNILGIYRRVRASVHYQSMPRLHDAVRGPGQVPGLPRALFPHSRHRRWRAEAHHVGSQRCSAVVQETHNLRSTSALPAVRCHCLRGYTAIAPRQVSTRSQPTAPAKPPLFKPQGGWTGANSM